MLDYTIEQINLFAHLAVKRNNLETFSNAHTAAVGAAVGFTGQHEILQKFAETLDIDVSKSSAVPSSLRNLLMQAVKTTRAAQDQQAQDGS